MQGWKVRDVYEGLSVNRVHTEEHIMGMYRELFGKNPQNLRHLGSRWNAIERYRMIRHRYVHGTRAATPEKLADATRLIADSVLDTTWLQRVEMPVDGVSVRLGDPYRRLASGRAQAKDPASLKDLLERAKRVA